MNTRILPIRNDCKWEGLSHYATSAPNLTTFESSPPRRRETTAELPIPKRKESIYFFASPYKNRKNVSLRSRTPATATTTTPAPNNCKPRHTVMSNSFAINLRGELEHINETKITPRQPKRQNAMVRLKPKRRESSVSSMSIPRHIAFLARPPLV